MGSRTQGDWTADGALTGNTLAVTTTASVGDATVTGTITVAGAATLNSTQYVSGNAEFASAIHTGTVATSSDVTDYTWMYVPNDGTNPPRMNRFETYDWGTGAWVGVYLSNGTWYTAT